MSNGDTTRIIRRPPGSGDSARQETKHTDQYDPEATRIVERPGTDEESTVVINQPGDSAADPYGGGDSDKTRLVRPNSQTPPGGIAPAPGLSPAQGVAGDAPAADVGEVTDPVVAWVVVVGGPGRGNALELGYGMNQVGRNPDNRVPLPFGDQEISRSAHAVITYDPRSRKYFVQPNTQGSNLTYIGAEQSPVLTPVELFGGELIRMGGTTLKFVPLCGESFDWSDDTLT